MVGYSVGCRTGRSMFIQRSIHDSSQTERHKDEIEGGRHKGRDRKTRTQGQEQEGAGTFGKHNRTGSGPLCVRSRGKNEKPHACLTSRLGNHVSARQLSFPICLLLLETNRDPVQAALLLERLVFLDQIRPTPASSPPAWLLYRV